MDFIRQLSERPTRDRTGFFWVEGLRHVLTAAQKDGLIQSLIVCPKLLPRGSHQEFVRKLRRGNTPVVILAPAEFRQVSTARTASGMGAIVKQAWTPIGRANSKPTSLWLVVDEIQSPGNLGTMLRTLAAMGGTGLICLGSQTDPFSTAVVRASMGAIARLTLVRSNLESFLRWCQRRGVDIVRLSPDGADPWDRAPLRLPAALMVGAERFGHPPNIRKLPVTSVRLPTLPEVDSVNVAVASGVMMFEFTRRFGLPNTGGPGPITIK